jgi:hypothetical protein
MASEFTSTESNQAVSPPSKALKIHRASSFQVVFALKRCPYRFMLLTANAKSCSPKQFGTALQQSKLLNLYNKEDEQLQENHNLTDQCEHLGGGGYQDWSAAQYILQATVAPMSTGTSSGVQELLAACGTSGKGNHERTSMASISSYFQQSEKESPTLADGEIYIHSDDLNTAFSPAPKKPKLTGCYQKAKRTKVKALLTRSINRSRKSSLLRNARKSTTKQPTILFDRCQYSRKSCKIVKSTRPQVIPNELESAKSNKVVVEDSVHVTGENELQCAGNEDLLPNVFECETLPRIIKKAIRLSRNTTPEPKKISERISELSSSHLASKVNSLKGRLKKIVDGKEYCKRHEDYKKGGKVRQSLSFQVSMGLFSEEQQEAVAKSLVRIFCPHSHKHFDYVMTVLLPESLILLQIECLGVSREQVTSFQS